MQPKRRFKTGRPNFQATREQRNLVMYASAAGRKLDNICLLVRDPRTGKPIDVNTLKANFQFELDTGALDLLCVAGMTLRRAMVRFGSVEAAKWVEKTRGGMKEGVSMTLQDPDGRPLTQQTVIILPANGRETGVSEAEAERLVRRGKHNGAGKANGHARH
jgi:hypothetical protein